MFCRINFGENIFTHFNFLFSDEMTEEQRKEHRCFQRDEKEN